MMRTPTSMTVAVTFRDAEGGRWTHTTMAHSTYEAVRNSWRWFQSEHWQGSRPTRETVFLLTMPTGELYRVAAAKALDQKPEEQKPQQSALFSRHRDAIDPK